MNANAIWTGAVLTGGDSRRMGTDKALLAVDGVAMALRVARALEAAGAAEVLCVGGNAVALAALGLVVVPDRHPGAGPLGALITALNASSRDIVVVAPCDLVAPDPAVASAVVVALLAAPAADGAVPVSGGVLQPLDGAFRTTAVAALARRFAAGERSVKRAIVDLVLVDVDVDGLSPRGLVDADTPEQLARDR